ncbi:MAG: hypothetical protein PUD16_04210, partial [bacterium]|nr:hypothetical protein [bacterium]
SVRTYSFHSPPLGLMALRPCATQGCAISYIIKRTLKMQVFPSLFFAFSGTKTKAWEIFDRIEHVSVAPRIFFLFSLFFRSKPEIFGVK